MTTGLSHLLVQTVGWPFQGYCQHVRRSCDPLRPARIFQLLRVECEAIQHVSAPAVVALLLCQGKPAQPREQLSKSLLFLQISPVSIRAISKLKRRWIIGRLLKSRFQYTLCRNDFLHLSPLHRVRPRGHCRPKMAFDLSHAMGRASLGSSFTPPSAVNVPVEHLAEQLHGRVVKCLITEHYRRGVQFRIAGRNSQGFAWMALAMIEPSAQGLIHRAAIGEIAIDNGFYIGGIAGRKACRTGCT